jgi:para-aminobenzoate synthetase component I
VADGQVRGIDGARPRVEEFRAWIDPLDALEAARGRRHTALLLSALPGHPSSRYSILAFDPAFVLEIRGSSARVMRFRTDGRGVEEVFGDDPFSLLRAWAPALPSGGLSGLPFTGGAIGCLGYGLRRAVESLPARPPDPLGQPDAWFGIYEAAAIFDAREGRVALVATEIASDRSQNDAATAEGRLDDLRKTLEKARGSPTRPPDSARRAEPSRRAALLTSREEYLERVERARLYIAAGDVYQVNLSHRIECPFDGDPIELFRRLAVHNPAPFAAYIDAGAFQILSASPERFVSVDGTRARSGPIKGTRPRGETPEEDRRLAGELLQSTKDRAENVMIADLVRSDLGRVSRPGSVKVAQLCALESFATVHHLVSTIEGVVRDGCDRIDLLRALFPAGSMTGAPKVRAMEIIDELEGEERGLYSGGLGYLSFGGRSEFNILIRTLFCQAGQVQLRVGGGIVADSVPELEFKETLDKARALLRALGARLRT